MCTLACAWDLKYHTAQTLVGQTLADLKLQENRWRKFWWLITLTIWTDKNLQHLADKTLADCYLFAKSTKVLFHQSFVLHGNALNMFTQLRLTKTRSKWTSALNDLTSWRFDH